VTKGRKMSKAELHNALFEKAIRFLSGYDPFTDEDIIPRVEGFVVRFLDTVIPEWSTEMPPLPPPEQGEYLHRGWWRIRKPAINFLDGVAEVVSGAGFDWLYFIPRGQGGTEEGELVPATRLQIRDGKLWGRAGKGAPWDIEATGYEFAGFIEFP